jgi:hypothetical protein
MLLCDEASLSEMGSPGQKPCILSMVNAFLDDRLLQITLYAKEMSGS